VSPVVTGEEKALIRPLTVADRSPLHSLLQETGFFSDEEIVIALELLDIVLERPGQQDYIAFCHESDGVVDGYYCVGPTPATSGTYDLFWIAVAPSAQGRGIGRSLNSHAEELLRSLGGRLMIAETSSRPQYAPTRGFYMRLGYEETARIRDYYKTGEDLVVYGKYLTHHKGG
jgi:ribosomal protein S18 acetylase RimI-like enzyme